MYEVQSQENACLTTKTKVQLLSALNFQNSNSASTGGGIIYPLITPQHSSPRMCIAFIYYSPLCGWPVALYSTSSFQPPDGGHSHLLVRHERSTAAPPCPAAVATFAETATLKPRLLPKYRPAPDTASCVHLLRQRE